MGDSTASLPTDISAEQLKRLIDGEETFELVDTRDDENFEGWRLADAIQFVYKPDHEFDLDTFTAATGLERNDSIVRAGARSKSVCGRVTYWRSLPASRATCTRLSR
ncbi:rhodanese-like domain-containing protein [Natronomonas salsuginis]|uniref:Uncharacterized protein n=1 Tax=Natronomonas salsuginis TaxID=2217661 RepID=A0A4V5ZPG6_9EURY|nr:rhodanese-like domain-containing protein [Natronomonas salsuginis]TKR27633.1 hypothetical protein DM868_00635 [Natronomonas salsuginis]